jgi:uncharacterized membrane protein
MGGTLMVAIAAAAFVGAHFLLSHPLRRRLVGAMGEGPFLGFYSLVALLTFGWLALAYSSAPATMFLWQVGQGLWVTATIVTLLASILFVGSLIGNPALPGAGLAPTMSTEPRGVFAITRHPMMWGFALWGLAHIAVFPTVPNIILAGAIVLLALVGSALQDRKKRGLMPLAWPQWQARTGFVPFGAALRGRVRLGRLLPGPVALIGGTLLWLVASWAHQPLAGWGAGIWRWIG